MRLAGGRRIAIGTVAVGAVISLGALVASREMILEQWYIHRLRSGDDFKMSGAIHRLREMKSLRAVPLLLEVAATSKTTHYNEKLSSQAWAALKEIRPGESFLLPRLCEGTSMERGMSLLMLVDVATERSIPLLKEIATRDDDLGTVAAPILARFLPTLTIQGIEEIVGERVAHLHLANYTPRELWYYSNSRLSPLVGFQRLKDGVWVDMEDAAALFKTWFMRADLAPKCAVSFRVPIPGSPEEFRVWTSFSDEDLIVECRVFSPAFRGGGP